MTRMNFSWLERILRTEGADMSVFTVLNVARLTGLRKDLEAERERKTACHVLHLKVCHGPHVLTLSRPPSIALTTCFRNRNFG